MIKIVIVEDQTMLRDSLAQTIAAQSDMEVVASLADAAFALDEVEKTGATCALLDVCTENDSSGTSLRAASRNPIPRCASSL